MTLIQRIVGVLLGVLFLVAVFVFASLALIQRHIPRTEAQAAAAGPTALGSGSGAPAR